MLIQSLCLDLGFFVFFLFFFLEQCWNNIFIVFFFLLYFLFVNNDVSTSQRSSLATKISHDSEVFKGPGFSLALVIAS